MTVFERNARYSYEEMLSRLKRTHDNEHLRTFSYKGFDIITISKQMRGIMCFFYREGKLIKMRNQVYKKDIIQYAY